MRVRLVVAQACRGQAFGPEVAVPDDAPPYDRLAAFFGRAP